MTILAPLNKTSSAIRQIHFKGIAAVIAALTISGCASNLATTSMDADRADFTAMGAGAAAITSDTTTPSVRMLGMTADRKLALRRLAERSIRTDNPGIYTVVTGDTLWDISERFLSRPWLWPEIWQVNPQIENPHLIYPGDRVSLTYVDGQPKLELIRASSGNGNPIGNYPTKALEPFLAEPKIISAHAMKRAPYVVGTEEDRLIASVGNHIYARGDLSASRYGVYRPGKALIDPDSEKLIGHEAILVSRASMVKQGDPSKLVITSNERETLIGDRLLAAEPEANLNFQPRSANVGTSGKIISMVDALARVGKNQVVVLNLGTEDGIQPGDILSVHGEDRRIRDTVSGVKHDWVTIEGEKSGVVMVFRTFEEASYALVVQSERTVNLYDRVGGMEF